VTFVIFDTLIVINIYIFESVKVPVELRVKLLIGLPRFSEPVRSLLLRLDHKRQDDYRGFKTFLWSEFQLTPFKF